MLIEKVVDDTAEAIASIEQVTEDKAYVINTLAKGTDDNAYLIASTDRKTDDRSCFLTRVETETEGRGGRATRMNARQGQGTSGKAGGQATTTNAREIKAKKPRRRESGRATRTDCSKLEGPLKQALIVKRKILRPWTLEIERRLTFLNNYG